MCGIVGFFSNSHYNSISSDLERANHAIKHRGPDQHGIYTDFKNNIQVGLGHRRLSIIDLSESGKQPMASNDGRIIVVFNGEIYNFKIIRAQLKSRGYSFKSQSDTEVIINAYREWGIDCIKKFNGMFAIGIYDKSTMQLILIRDRIGIKPLYYYYNQDILIFASELKSLMEFRCFPKIIDFDSIALFLHYQYIPSPNSIFKNTYKLLPGHYLIFDGRRINHKKYWKIPDIKDHMVHDNVEKESRYIEDLDTLLTDSVSDMLISDVPIGALLSGGVDSSLIAALMQKVGSNPVRTFSIGFSEDKYNEAPWAKKIAAHLGTNHTELYIRPAQALDAVPKLPDIYDEPFADSSAIPTFIVSKLARSHVTVALSGDGGDEQFAGYVRYWVTQDMEKLLSHFPHNARVFLAKVLGAIRPSLVERYYLNLYNHLPQRLRISNFHDKWQKLIMQLSQDQLCDLYRVAICIWQHSDLEILIGQSLSESMYEKVFSSTSSRLAISRLMRVDQSTYLPDDMLAKVDRASMASSLEIRVPLLDHRVVEFSSNLPAKIKYKNKAGKYLLRKVLERYIPNDLFERPKMGFGVPIENWLRHELKELMLDYLSEAQLKKEGLFRVDFIDKIIKEHLNGKRNHHSRIWAILMWEMWREKWLS